MKTPDDPTWADVPMISGTDLATAFWRAGFDVGLDGPGRALIKRLGGELVGIVPLVEELRPEAVAAIARLAGLTPGQLIACLFLPSPP